MNSKERKIIGLTVVVVAVLLIGLYLATQGKVAGPAVVPAAAVNGAPAATQASAETNVTGQPMKAPAAPPAKNKGTSVEIPLDDAIKKARQGRYDNAGKPE